MTKRRYALASGAGLVGIVAAVVAVLVGTAGADGTGGASSGAMGTPVADLASQNIGPLPPKGQMQDLMKNTAFRDEYFGLRRTFLSQEQSWWDTYAAEPQSGDAQAAMAKLRQQQRQDMADLLKKYGVTLPTPPAGIQKLEQLQSNAKFRADMEKLRTHQQAEMQAWFKKYGSDPSSTAAARALKKLRAKHQAALKALLSKYGVKAGDLPGMWRREGPAWGPGMMNDWAPGMMKRLGPDMMNGRGLDNGRGHGWGPGMMGGGDSDTMRGPAADSTL